MYIGATNTKVRKLDIEALVRDETNKTVMLNFVTTEWGIDGTIKITKNDKLKRKLDFAGREKARRQKKEKPNQPL